MAHLPRNSAVISELKLLRWLSYQGILRDSKAVLLAHLPRRNIVIYATAPAAHSPKKTTVISEAALASHLLRKAAVISEAAPTAHLPR